MVMVTENLFRVLQAIHPMSDDFKNWLEKELIHLTLPKNKPLLDIPQISEFIYFLNKGFAISFSYYHHRKITEAFWKSGQIMLSFESFFDQTPSREVILIAEDSELLCISYASVQRMFELYPEAQHVYRGIMNEHYKQSRKRVMDMQRLSALERFKNLLEEFPDIELIVSQDAIASYLGIAAQSLSRLKRQQSGS